MTTLIVGCGDLGIEIGIRLIADGERVIGWRRSLPAAPEGIVFEQVDITSKVTYPSEPISGLVITTAPGRGQQDRYEATYLTGLRNTLAALARSDAYPHRAVLVSSTAVYGEIDGRVDEDTPITDSSDRVRILREAETTFTEFFSATSTEAAVLRLSGIYGPERTRLIDTVRDGTAVIPDQPTMTNRIHRDDAAAAVVHLLRLPSRPDELYLGVDDRPAELGEVIAFLADRLDVPLPPIGAVTRRRGGTRACANDRLKATGFAFAYPDYASGYGHLIDDPRGRHR